VTDCRAIPTRMQMEVLEAIESYIEKHRFSPSLKELCDAIGTVSTGSMTKHLAGLEACGVIKRRRGSRQIFLTNLCPYCGAKAK